VQNGEIEVAMGGISITSERSAQVAFTRSYYQLGQMALVRSEDAGRLMPEQAIYRLPLRVGYEAGTTGEIVVATLESATPVPFPEVETGLAALRAGKVDAFVHDAPTVWVHATPEPGPGKLVALPDPLTEEELAFAIRRGDTDRKRQMDQVLARLEFDGRLRMILARWIKVPGR
jgi:ABC-type amino acid transport substrate-binding protein